MALLREIDERAHRDVAVSPAATVCVLHPGSEGMQVLMVRRSADAAFSGARVYQTVLDEQAALDGDALVLLDVWLTPPGPARRFDTSFFVTALPDGRGAGFDGVEVTAAAWVTPRQALEKASRGEWYVGFPTRKHLEMLSSFTSPEEPVEHARRQSEVSRVEPRIRHRDGEVDILLPDDPGYDELAP